MKRLTVCLRLAILFAVSLVLFVSTSHAQQKTVALNYSNWFPATTPQSKLAEQWCKDVETRTNGRVKVSYFPGGILTPADQMYDSVINGIADVGTSMTSFTKGRFPLTEVIDLPLGYKSGSQGTYLVNAYYSKFRPKEFDQVKVMYLSTTPPLILHTKTRPVYKLEDLKGLKIRGTGNSVRLVQLLGGTPVGLVMSECYDALAKGVIDGVSAAYDPLQNFRIGEQLKYSMEFNATYVLATYVVMNKQKWASISSEDQKTIEAMNEEYIPKQAAVWDKVDKDAKDWFIARGGKIIQISKEEDARWVKAVSPMIDEYVTSMKAKGLPGEEALKFCRDWLKSH